MRLLSYCVGTTIDGFIAAPDGSYDFFEVGPDVVAFLKSELPDTLPTHVRGAWGVDSPTVRYDTVVMGRRTYQPGLDVGVTSPYRHLRQYVVSGDRSLPEDPEVTLVRDDPLALVRALKAEDGLDIWLAGGGVLAGSLLPEIDELVVKRYPVVAGAGIPVFAGPFSPQVFRPVAGRDLGGGATVVTYRRG
ncbi:dihydrofolate reductase family protein [Geodermatophilus sp. YIM 151500]|uniref:dihydrofolate reductase family protein n=1 Tax=Geodermatophilus sp. YIM 151500 TaxID=2984531 RepID=UPI0021E39E6F|nr:dihydrofolate reductase family protein [Geodermatophilus sp. YIM 151500]MCV2488069.1 dihydrofolate reductase family protein [Geodermatophilus sp. YIM 151500]